MRLFRRTISNK